LQQETTKHTSKIILATSPLFCNHST